MTQHLKNPFGPATTCRDCFFIGENQNDLLEPGLQTEHQFSCLLKTFLAIDRSGLPLRSIAFEQYFMPKDDITRALTCEYFEHKGNRCMDCHHHKAANHKDGTHHWCHIEFPTMQDLPLELHDIDAPFLCAFFEDEKEQAVSKIKIDKAWDDEFKSPIDTLQDVVNNPPKMKPNTLVLSPTSYVSLEESLNEPVTLFDPPAMPEYADATGEIKIDENGDVVLVENGKKKLIQKGTQQKTYDASKVQVTIDGKVLEGFVAGDVVSVTTTGDLPNQVKPLGEFDQEYPFTVEEDYERRCKTCSHFWYRMPLSPKPVFYCDRMAGIPVKSETCCESHEYATREKIVQQLKMLDEMENQKPKITTRLLRTSKKRGGE